VRIASASRDIPAEVSPSVVMVWSRSPEAVRAGSGFVIGTNRIATCAHLVRDATQIVVIAGDGRRLEARLGPFEAVHDIAILNSSSPLPPSLRLGDSDLARPGEAVAVTGYPADTVPGEAPQVPVLATLRGSLAGKVTRPSPANDLVDLLQLRAEIGPGFSGGPVYSVQDGRVLGLASFRLNNQPGAGFATPVNVLRRLAGL
jgi:serine protease Do